ncbi:hypothetical protein ABPG72_018720 [Tetrahymena utriculariae]
MVQNRFSIGIFFMALWAIKSVLAQITIRKQVFYQMNISSNQEQSTEGWILVQGDKINLSNCVPTDNYSPAYVYGTRDQNLLPSNEYYCTPGVNSVPYEFQIARSVMTNLPHYQIGFDVELILFGSWIVQGEQACPRSDYLVLTADQNQFKFTLQDAYRNQYACQSQNTVDEGYLLKITNVINHKANILSISLASNTLSDSSIVSFGIRKFNVYSNLCPDQYCSACIDQYTCTSCTNDLLVSFDGRQCLQSCPTNFLIQQRKCVQTCGQNSILDIPSKTCVLCDPNCQICQSQYYCSQCYSNYYQFQGKCYQTCPINSIAPTDGSNLCKECSPGCSVCNTSGKCSQCNKQYALVKGQCQSCYDPNCAQCQDSGIYGCLTCSNGYYFSEKKCISDKCQDSVYRLANKECQVCMGGYYYDVSQDSCIECHSLCHDCTGTGWDQCKQCSSIRWRYVQSENVKQDTYLSKLGICDCQYSDQFDTINDTCQQIGQWNILTYIMLFFIFFASLQLAYRGKMLYLMNFMYIIQSLSLLGFLNMPYPYFLQDIFTGFNRVNLPNLLPRVFQIDQDKMTLSGRQQTVYFSNSSAQIEEIFSFPKLMLYYNMTSNFLLNFINYFIINLIPLFCYVFIRVYERVKGVKFIYERTIKNEIIPFFLYHSLLALFIYIILQFQHASTFGALQVISTVCAVISLVVIVVMVYFHTFTLMRSINLFKKKDKNHDIFRFSIYLRDINFINGNIFQQNFRTIQTLKQFILVCCIVGAYNKPVTQAILVIVFQFIYYMILIVVKPFTTAENNKQQIIYETLLFFCLFLGCWYEFSFGIEGQTIKQFVGVSLILGIFLIVFYMMTVTLYNFYKIEKPIFIQYMAKRRLINREKERQKMTLQQKKNSITEYVNKDGQSQSKDNDISYSDSEKSKSVENQASKKALQRNQTPKHILPNGLKSSKNAQSTNNKNAINQVFNQNDETIQVQPDYREAIKENQLQFNNSQILMSELPPNSAINGGLSRRNPYAQNNQSMSYFLNETDQNIITETYIKQQNNENPNILSVLDDEIIQNLQFNQTNRMQQNNDNNKNNNNSSFQDKNNMKQNLINNNPNQKQNNMDDTLDNQNQLSLSRTVNFAEAEIIQFDKSGIYLGSNKKDIHSVNSNLNDTSGLHNKTTQLEEGILKNLKHDDSNDSIILKKNERYQPSQNDNQSFGQTDNRSVLQKNEEDDYNKTFLINNEAIQDVAGHLINHYADNSSVQHIKTNSNTLHASTEQGLRPKTQINSRSSLQNGLIQGIQQNQNLQVQNQNGQEETIKLDNSHVEKQNYLKNYKFENSQTGFNYNNQQSNSNLDIKNNHNNQSMLNDSLLNQSIDPMRGTNILLSSVLNSSGIKKPSQPKGVLQQTGKQISTLNRTQSQKQELVKAFKEAPQKQQQKFVTKKKKNQKGSNLPQKQDQQQQQPTNPTQAGLNSLNQQTNSFIKKALDTELMYKWKDQSYNYDQEEDY